MTAKQLTGLRAPDGSEYVTLTDGAGNLSPASGGGGGGAATIADGADVAQGATTDAAYAGSGNTTVVGALKGIYGAQILTGSLGTASPQVVTVQGGLSGLPLASLDAGNLSSGTGTASVTSATSIFSIDTTGYNGISVQVTSAGTTCTITYETSNDNATWVSVVGFLSTSGTSALTLNTYGVSTSTVVGLWIFPTLGRYFRARVSTYTSGTVTAFYCLRKNFQSAYSVANVIASSSATLPVFLNSATSGGYSFLNIVAGQATTTVKSGAGTLHAIVFNGSAAATNVTTIYDNTAGSGTVIGIPAATAVTAPTDVIYDLAFATGLTIVTATANGANMTVIYK